MNPQFLTDLGSLLTQYGLENVFWCEIIASWENKQCVVVAEVWDGLEGYEVVRRIDTHVIGRYHDGIRT
jgi:hypothetical protein